MHIFYHMVCVSEFTSPTRPCFFVISTSRVQITFLVFLLRVHLAGMRSVELVAFPGHAPGLAADFAGHWAVPIARCRAW